MRLLFISLEGSTAQRLHNTSRSNQVKNLAAKQEESAAERNRGSYETTTQSKDIWDEEIDKKMLGNTSDEIKSRKMANRIMRDVRERSPTSTFTGTLDTYSDHSEGNSQRSFPIIRRINIEEVRKHQGSSAESLYRTSIKLINDNRIKTNTEEKLNDQYPEQPENKSTRSVKDRIDKIRDYLKATNDSSDSLDLFTKAIDNYKGTYLSIY